jgi:hypothetical protein
MQQLEKQRMCVKFCFKLGKTFVETFELLKKAYTEECMSRTQCYKWSKRFKELSMKTPGLDDLPHQQMTAMSKEFVR